MAEKGPAQTCPHCDYPADGGAESLLHLPPGTVLQNKYIIGRALGQGGFGITYLAWDKILSLKLAIKEYLPQQLVTRTGGERTVTVFKPSLQEEFTYGKTKFLEEARTLARFIEHPNIVSVRDYFEANGTAYLVMNYHEGVTLHAYLQSRGGRVEAGQAVKIFMPVLDALKEVHGVGILHRDISPDNLLIDKNGRVILIDFGAARLAMGEKSRSLSVIMKAGYSPEEQYRSRGRQGPWTDIYAVAATMYRAVTGHAPPESMDRLAHDDLALPSQLGVEISAGLEQTLLKALAVKAKDRFHTVAEFQASLLELGSGRSSKEEFPETATYRNVQEGSNIWKNKKARLYAGALVMFLVLVILVTISFLFNAPTALLPSPTDELTATTEEAESAIVPTIEDGTQETIELNEEGDALDEPTHAGAANESATYPSGNVVPEADFYIDYTGGTVPLGDLPIGTLVVDLSWEWEYRLGANYSNTDWEGGPTPQGEVKPVTWIVVAHDHYDLSERHVTLLSKELIGLFAFDDSTDRDHEYAEYGYNHWGESGKNNADHGLRPWLNSTGHHAGEGFYREFSADFRNALLTTAVPNREWESGSAYSTSDNVFIPSSTELNDENHEWTYRIGNVYAYFAGAGDEQRIAMMVGDGWYDLAGKLSGDKFMEEWSIYGNNWFYWSRSPASTFDRRLRSVVPTGDFYIYALAFGASYGVRPALNLKAETLVTEINQ